MRGWGLDWNDSGQESMATGVCEEIITGILWNGKITGRRDWLSYCDIFH
jgi:hypothetical protein